MSVDPIEIEVNETITLGDNDNTNIFNTMETNSEWNSWRDEIAKSMYNERRGHCDVLFVVYDGNKRALRRGAKWDGKLSLRVSGMFERGCANRMECDNGFRTGYLGILEQLLNRSCLDSGLLANPHISSKIHEWKKTYGCINDMMGRSGFGCNATTQSIDVKDYVFNNFAKIDPFAKTLRYKSFSYYAQWCEVFGKDRAMGDRGLDPIVAPRNPGNPTPNERSENLPLMLNIMC
ncbi:UNVERIFIED_CONTAM: hypothetical protein Sangu_2762300 [Sesamum angustifolium]|uniref:Uncharacterized protein n=1 Tax=Sesamum angustifolium TaxID=2727405 RepID=A0AAW2IWN0_9LAMI